MFDELLHMESTAFVEKVEAVDTIPLHILQHKQTEHVKGFQICSIFNLFNPHKVVGTQPLE